MIMEKDYSFKVRSLADVDFTRIVAESALHSPEAIVVVGPTNGVLLLSFAFLAKFKSDHGVPVCVEDLYPHWGYTGVFVENGSFQTSNSGVFVENGSFQTSNSECMGTVPGGYRCRKFDLSCLDSVLRGVAAARASASSTAVRVLFP